MGLVVRELPRRQDRPVEQRRRLHGVRRGDDRGRQGRGRGPEGLKRRKRHRRIRGRRQDLLVSRARRLQGIATLGLALEQGSHLVDEDLRVRPVARCRHDARDGVEEPPIGEPRAVRAERVVPEVFDLETEVRLDRLLLHRVEVEKLQALDAAQVVVRGRMEFHQGRVPRHRVHVLHELLALLEAQAPVSRQARVHELSRVPDALGLGRRHLGRRLHGRGLGGWSGGGDRGLGSRRLEDGRAQGLGHARRRGGRRLGSRGRRKRDLLGGQDHDLGLGGRRQHFQLGLHEPLGSGEAELVEVGEPFVQDAHHRVHLGLSLGERGLGLIRQHPGLLDRFRDGLGRRHRLVGDDLGLDGLGLRLGRRRERRLDHRGAVGLGGLLLRRRRSDEQSLCQLLCHDSLSLCSKSYVPRVWGQFRKQR